MQMMRPPFNNYNGKGMPLQPPPQSTMNTSRNPPSQRVLAMAPQNWQKPHQQQPPMPPSSQQPRHPHSQQSNNGHPSTNYGGYFNIKYTPTNQPTA